MNAKNQHRPYNKINSIYRYSLENGKVMVHSLTHSLAPQLNGGWLLIKRKNVISIFYGKMTRVDIFVLRCTLKAISY